MNWETHARRLAADVVRPESRWHEALATTPRHLFVPRWWKSTDQAWQLHDGRADPELWMRSAYTDRTLVTRIGTRHADDADPHTEVKEGIPTSSSTLPGLVVTLYRHAMIADGSRVLVTTGSGYGTALMCRRLGDEHVVSVDIDPYLVKAATERLGEAGAHPDVRVADITGDLPGRFDRIISTVAVPAVPASWLHALNPGGRLVTTVAGTGLLITADKTDDGGARGRVEWDRAAFMVTRHGPDYPPDRHDLFEAIRDRDGGTSRSAFPVVDVRNAWELWSTHTLHHPGVEHWYEETDGRRTAWMAHPDGSWARASGTRTDPATVHQGGPRHLWDELDRIRRWWLADGYLNTYGATVTITPDGATTLTRGGWTATLG